ncbi:hypothetical protein HY969_02925 [Candidatus Kaiserbacteria bacterium]|nr:hypothetical protein [Candidatus Kaiserbacteria bacterium]
MIQEKQNERETQLRKYLDDRTAKAKERYENYIETVHAMADDNSRKNIQGWGVFGSELTGAQGYFGADRNLAFTGTGGYDEESLALELAHARTDTEKRILAADFLGQGRACIDLGADAVIATTLLPQKDISSEVETILGDALSEEVSNRTFERIKQLKDEGHAFLLAFFRPVGGLYPVSTNLYVLRTIMERFSQIYDLLDEKGLLFIGSMSVSDYDIGFLKYIIELCGLEGIIKEPITKSGICIQKNSRICKHFPSETEIAMKYPALIRRLINLDENDKSTHRAYGIGQLP